MNWSDLSVMITGGTGTFGRKMAEILLKEKKPKRLIIFSRDELKQHEMYASGFSAPCMRYFIGDVRDRERLRRAMNGVDVVIHAAAMKQVPTCEYNPFEAVKTNINGSQNIIDCAIDCGVKKVIAISTDKAVNPVNLYGATKLCAEKLFVQGNYYSGGDGTKFSCTRYGNVIGSRGSVIPVFLAQKNTGMITITDERMTRFWLTINEGVHFVLKCLNIMQGGEVFVPKLPSMKVIDVAKAIAPSCRIRIIGIRPGEKLHESLISFDEAPSAIELKDMYVIQPTFPWWDSKKYADGRKIISGFEYTSDKNTKWLTVKQFLELARTNSSIVLQDEDEVIFEFNDTNGNSSDELITEITCISSEETVSSTVLSGLYGKNAVDSGTERQ